MTSQKRLRGGGSLRRRRRLLGRLSNDDGDVNENGKKAIGLDQQNNNFARASRFSLPSLSSLHDYDVKMLSFTSSGGREHTTTTFFFFSGTSTWSFRIQLQKNLPTFDESNVMACSRLGHFVSCFCTC